MIASEATAAAIPGVHEYKKYYFTKIAGTFTDDTYPAPAHVDVTFKGTYTLPVEGARVELRELSHAGVSSTQTVAHIANTNSLLVGDLVHHRAHAWLEGGIVDGKPTPTLDAWAAALDELLHYPDSTVFGGRGDAAPVADAVAAQKAYLQKADTLVTEHVRALPNAKEALEGPDAGKEWAKLRATFEETFPECRLSYLTEYGVYGLALSKLP